MCRCMSGFTDAFYVDRTARFSDPAVLLPARPPYYHTLESPDVWFAPTVRGGGARGAQLCIHVSQLGARGSGLGARGLTIPQNPNLLILNLEPQTPNLQFYTHSSKP
jgi:hypothetical protein